MTQLHLTDTRTGLKTAFTPADPTAIGLYVCGPTVYDRAHLGNARSAVVFDLLYRVLGHVHGRDAVNYARNFTDIDDKIIAAAQSRYPDQPATAAAARITRETIAWYHEDMDALGVLRPDFEPRATQYVEQMVEDIARMIARGGAYIAGTGRETHVFFSAEANIARGWLSGRTDLADDSVHRVEPHPLKRHPADFVLWKPSASDQPGWPSPWGIGRPGWHIECSAMSTRILGSSFDIHGGGSDLVFPHHDNEVAQARCCNPKAEYARTWVHNGMITVKGRKMSKSLGNFTTVADLRDRLPGGAIRLALMSAHYRASLDWTPELEREALGHWTRWRSLAAEATPDRKLHAGFEAALLDDLNTAQAIAEMHRMASAGELGALRKALDLMGISLADDRPGLAAPIAAHIEALLAQRTHARDKRDFARSDAIRDVLIRAGIILKDGADGTTWEQGPDCDPDMVLTIQLDEHTQTK